MADSPNLSDGQIDGSPQRPDCFILKMPLEILSQVVEEVAQQSGAAATVARLARTCRTLHGVVVVRLYAHFNDQAMPIIRYRAPNLHRTLYNNRDLGRLVRTMLFRSPRIEAVHALNMDFRDHPDYSLALRQLFGLDPSQTSSLQEPINIMMLACLAPNLRSVDVTAAPQWRNTDFLLDFANGRVTGPRITLGNLTLLSVHQQHNSQPGTGINLHKLNGLLHTAPNLSRLFIDFARGGTSLNSRLPHLTTLVLLQSLLCARGLRHLLRGCHGLVTLLISHDHRARVPARFTPISAAQILECLTPSKDTLQHLLMWPWVPPPDDPREAEYAFLPDRLGDFPALKQLSIDYRMLGRRFHDDRALVELLSGLEQLEGFMVFSAHLVSPPTFTALADAILGLEWPRLRAIKLRAMAHPLMQGQILIEREFRQLLCHPEVLRRVWKMRDRSVMVTPIPT